MFTWNKLTFTLEQSIHRSNHMTRGLIAPPGLPWWLCTCRQAERDWLIFKIIKPLGKRVSFILLTCATKSASFWTRAGPRIRAFLLESLKGDRWETHRNRQAVPVSYCYCTPMVTLFNTRRLQPIDSLGAMPIYTRWWADNSLNCMFFNIQVWGQVT